MRRVLRVHWLLYNVPPKTTGLPGSITVKDVLEDGSRQGLNDSKKPGYSDRPCGGSNEKSIRPSYAWAYYRSKRLSGDLSEVTESLLDQRKGKIGENGGSTELCRM